MENNKKHVPNYEISTYGTPTQERQSPRNTYTYSGTDSVKTHGGSYLRNRDKQRGNGGSNEGTSK